MKKHEFKTLEELYAVYTTISESYYPTEDINGYVVTFHDSVETKCMYTPCDGICESCKSEI